ncbi:MAG: hypothetical protein Q9217_004299 [Psora testacea]
MSSHPSDDTKIAIGAIAIALCALVISSGQILGQYFATAEGYRRCQPSVMGPWAKRTRLRWRWRQFRFETLFTTPEIFLAKLRIDQKQQIITTISSDDKIERISGSPESRHRTMVSSTNGEQRSNELVCWLPFLESLHRNEWELQRYGCYDHQLQVGDPSEQQQLVGPAVRFREMSWDFMSPDIVRPFAVTTVSDIAIIVRRLGMSWEVFKPEEGLMRAEGNGHGIASTFARSIGLILQYVRVEGGVTPSPKSFFSDVTRLPKAELYIPTREADMMGFGILPGYDRLKIPFFKVGTIDEVYATMDILDSTRKASRKLRDINRLLVGKWDAHCTYGFPDIIPLAAPMIRRRGSTIVRIPTPAEYCSSLLSHKEGFVVFHNRLQEYLRGQAKNVKLEQANWVLEQYENLKVRYSEWENEAGTNERVNECNLAFLEEVHGCWEAATDYFVRLRETDQLHYYDLMACHVSHAVNYWGDGWKRLNSGTARENYGLGALETEGTHLYFDYLPLIVADMRTKGFDGPEELVHEAWFTLIFRAFCWWRCHSVYPGQDQGYKGSTLRSRYWDSKLPVYIG